MPVVLSHPKTGTIHGVRLDSQPKSDNARSPRLVSTAQSSGIPTAFTLVELLLVLAVLAMLSSVALPRVGRMLAKAEHRAAADSLHAALSQLRLQAIQAGRTHSLRYVPGSGIFELRAEGADEIGQIDFTEGDSLAGGAIDTSLEQSGSDGSHNSGRENASLADWAGADTLTKPLDDSEEFSMESDSTTGDMMSGDVMSRDHVERRQLTSELWLVSSLEEEPTSPGGLAYESDAGGRQKENLMGELQDVSLTDDSTATQWSAPILFFPDGRASDARLFVMAPSGYAIELNVIGISGKVQVGNRLRLPEGANQLDLPASVQLEPNKDRTIGSERTAKL